MTSSTSEKEKHCAYCGGTGPFTKEHVVPSFLYQKHPNSKFGYNWKAKKYHQWEATIGDVCKKCNNDRLSILDQYGEHFYSINRCDREFYSANIVRIKYNYNLLLRWLLKISFNAIRSKGGHSEFMEKCVPFILYGDNLPYHSDVFVEIIKNERITHTQKRVPSKEFQNLTYLSTEGFAFGSIGIITANIEVQFEARYVSINSFFFYLFLFPQDCLVQIRSIVLENILQRGGRVTPLEGDRQSVGVMVSPRTLLDVRNDRISTEEISAWNKSRYGKLFKS